MGPMVLFSGCRAEDSDLHAEEKAAAVKEGVLDHVFLALSRSPPIPKVTFSIFICMESQNHSIILCSYYIDIRPRYAIRRGSNGEHHVDFPKWSFLRLW